MIMDQPYCQGRPYRFWSAEEITAIWGRRGRGETWTEIAAWLSEQRERVIEPAVVRCAAWNWKRARKVVP